LSGRRSLRIHDSLYNDGCAEVFVLTAIVAEPERIDALLAPAG
jgi:hypothetical protein